MELRLRKFLRILQCVWAIVKEEEDDDGEGMMPTLRECSVREQLLNQRMIKLDSCSIHHHLHTSPFHFAWHEMVYA